MMADRVSDSFSVGFFVSMVFLAVSLIVTGAQWMGDGKIYSTGLLQKMRFYSLLGLIIFGFLWTLTPNTKTLAAMYVVPSIVNSKAIQQDVPEIYNLAIEKLKETINTKKAEKQ